MADHPRTDTKAVLVRCTDDEHAFMGAASDVLTERAKEKDPRARADSTASRMRTWAMGEAEKILGVSFAEWRAKRAQGTTKTKKARES